MRRYVKLILLWTLLLWLAPAVVLAQGTACPDIVKTALAAAEQLCQNTGRNQACYGNVDLKAQPQPGIENFSFSALGDIVDVAALQSLIVSPMDEASGKWGVAIMKLQASLPDTLPGQNITFLLFGDVELVNGVSPDNTTLRPMQAFYLRTGIRDAKCEQAPQSGMLVQTPQGAGEVNFTVNGVDLQMGSTVFFQAEVKKQMTVSTLEGTAFIKAKDKTSVILPGSSGSVPLGGPEAILEVPSGGGPTTVFPITLPGGLITSIVDLLPGGEPEAVYSYQDDFDALGVLPLNLLEREIEIASPLSDEEIQAINEQIEQGVVCGEGPLPSCDVFQESPGEGSSGEAVGGEPGEIRSGEPPGDAGGGSSGEAPEPPSDNSGGGGEGGGGDDGG